MEAITQALGSHVELQPPEVLIITLQGRLSSNDADQRE